MWDAQRWEALWDAARGAQSVPLVLTPQAHIEV